MDWAEIHLEESSGEVNSSWSHLQLQSINYVSSVNGFSTILLLAVNLMIWSENYDEIGTFVQLNAGDILSLWGLLIVFGRE